MLGRDAITWDGAFWLVAGVDETEIPRELPIPDYVLDAHLSQAHRTLRDVGEHERVDLQFRDMSGRFALTVRLSLDDVGVLQRQRLQ